MRQGWNVLAVVRRDYIHPSPAIAVSMWENNVNPSLCGRGLGETQVRATAGFSRGEGEVEGAILGEPG